MLVRNETRGCVIADTIEIADTSAKRCKGLLGRGGLPEGHALWIIPCESVHTWFMRFPIDVVYLDRKHRVRKACKAVPPWRVSMCFFAHSVLELPAGIIDKTRTQRGDQLSVSPLNPDCNPQTWAICRDYGTQLSPANPGTIR